MPAKWFEDDENKYLIEDVLSGKVEMEKYPLAYLKEAAGREWDGNLHVTDLNNGDRETFLKYTTFYSVNPDKLAFAISGTLKHAQLESENEWSEKKIKYKGIKGTLDLLQKNNDGTFWLVDYKTQGAFAVRKFLGWVKTYEPEVDTNGVPVKFKSGKRKGEQKYKSRWILDPTKADKDSYNYQLNIYRKAIEETFDIKISKMKIFFILRDGGLTATVNQGLDRNTYFLDVDFLSDEVIDKKIESKLYLKDRIEEFINFDETDPKAKMSLLKKLVPDMCTEKERWHDKETGVDRKCESYCPVREVCRMLK